MVYVIRFLQKLRSAISEINSDMNSEMIKGYHYLYGISLVINSEFISEIISAGCVLEKKHFTNTVYLEISYIYISVFRHALLTLFTARTSWDLASRWAFGPKGLKNIQTLVTLTTVAMATKKKLPELMKHLKGYGILSGWPLGGTRIVVIDFCYNGNHSVALATKKVNWDSQNSTNWQCCNPTNKALGEGHGASKWYKRAWYCSEFSAIGPSLSYPACYN